MRLAIIGPGRMGLALGAALKSVDAVEHLTYYGRSIEEPSHPIFDDDDVSYRVGVQPLPPGTQLVILAVPDGALAEVAYELSLAGDPPPGCVALHLAGALSTEVLSPLHARGYAVGSMHPLQAIANAWHSAQRLFGSAFALAGEPEAVAFAKRLIVELDGMPLIIPPNKRPVYHASAVVASNFLIAVLSLATRLMMEAGVSEHEALTALLPLTRGTLENLDTLGIGAALTGPIIRGDAETLRIHLTQLSGHDRALYCQLGLELLGIARAAGLDPDKANQIEQLLAPAH
jgi:predicted short-subunit dehydrogenase-like oxidoreductase (DUF2520 family)